MGDTSRSSPDVASVRIENDVSGKVEWNPLEIEEHPIDSAPRIKAIVVGSGIAGINAAILLPTKVPGLDLVIYERSSDIVRCILISL